MLPDIKSVISDMYDSRMFQISAALSLCASAFSEYLSLFAARLSQVLIRAMVEVIMAAASLDISRLRITVRKLAVPNAVRKIRNTCCRLCLLS